jgi:outer membrane protein TolC
MSASGSVAALVILWLWALPAGAQEIQVPSKDVLASRAFEPPRLAQPMVTLSQAVELTIRQSAAIRRSVQTLLEATGRARQTRGIFDLTLSSAPNLAITRVQLTPFLLNNEINKRFIITTVANEFTSLTVILRQLIAQTSTGVPRCPANLNITSPAVDLTRLDSTQTAILGLSRNLGSTVLVNLSGVPQTARLTSTGITTGIDLGDICARPIDPLLTPDAFGGVLKQIDESGGLGLNGILTSVGQIPLEMRRLEEQITETVAYRAQLALDKLGPVPEDQLTKKVAFNFTGSKLFRNGLSADGTFLIESQEQNFVDKPLDPGFGGMGLPNEFFSSASGDLIVPLFHGRGAVSTAAPERAAARIATAAREQLRHDVTDSVFGTVVAYINLAAAQETARLLDESAARNEQILTLTRQRATAGDLPGFEVGRVQAQVATIAGAAAEARAAVQTARLSLAAAMGVAVTSLGEAPLTQELLTSALAELPETKVDVDRARGARRDARAARLRQDAADILAAGARADQRRTVNLTLTGGFTNLYDSPLFQYIPDGAILQTTPVPVAQISGAPPGKATLPPVRYYDPRGSFRSLTGRYTPYATVTVTWQLPFGNNSAKGRAVQADANLREAAIQSTDLSRVIDHSVIASSEDVRRAANAVLASQTAVQSDNTLLGTILQLLQTGDRTIIDTLLTEESITSDQLRLVARRQAYLTALARLKFDAASLVTFEHEGTSDEQMRFLTTDFVGR